MGDYIRGSRRGRPESELSRKNQYRLRMSDEERDMLNELSLNTGKNKSEIFREALNMYANLVKYRD